MKFGSLPLVFLLAVAAQAATWQVQATGTCSTDTANLQNAVNSAAAGDTIQLQPGSSGNVFDLSCSAGNPAIFVNTPDLSLSASSPVILQGPAVADYSGSIGILDQADALTISGLTIRNFTYGVFSANSSGPTHSLSISNARLENNANGLWSMYGNMNVTVVNSTVIVPQPADPTPGSSTLGLLVLGGYSVIGGNTVTGPGVSLHMSSVADVQNIVSNAQGLIRSVGIFQIDYLPQAPISYYSLISNNQVSGFDLGMQVSSTYGATIGNHVTHCAFGLQVSQDSDNGVTATTHATVTQNVSTDNQVGFMFASVQDSVASLNDFLHNSVKDIILIANPNGPPSVRDRFVLTPGSRADLNGGQSSAQ
jgi:hypothetical protein